jgi:hypothetical protein
MQFSKMAMPPFKELELFSHDLRSMMVSFSIFSGQRNDKILISSTSKAT